MPERAGLLGSFNSRMSLADLEIYKRYAEEVSIDDKLKANKKEMKTLRRKIKKQYTNLRSFIIKESLMGSGADIDSDPTLSSISLLDAVSNEGPLDLIEDAKNYRLYEANMIEPTFVGLNAIYSSLVEEKRSKLEGLVYDIRKSNLRVREIEYEMGFLYNLKADKIAEKSIRQKGDEKRALIKTKRYCDYLHKLLSIVEDIPKTESTTEIEDKYISYMTRNTVDYIYYKIKLIKEFPLLPEDITSDAGAKRFKTYLDKLPPQFSEITPDKVQLLYGSLLLMSNRVNDSLVTQKQEISKEEGLSNNFLEETSKRVRDILTSDSYSKRVAEQKNSEQLKEDLNIEKSNIDNKLDTINQVVIAQSMGRDSLEDILSGKAPIKNSSLRKLLRNLAYRTGGVREINPDTQRALEEAIREQVRGEYGGNLPFEDEEVVVDKNNVKRFVQKKYLTLVKGEYRITEEIQEEGASKKYSDPKDIAK